MVAYLDTGRRGYNMKLNNFKCFLEHRFRGVCIYLYLQHFLMNLRNVICRHDHLYPFVLLRVSMLLINSLLILNSDIRKLRLIISIDISYILEEKNIFKSAKVPEMQEFHKFIKMLPNRCIILVWSSGCGHPCVIIRVWKDKP